MAISRKSRKSRKSSHKSTGRKSVKRMSLRAKSAPRRSSYSMSHIKRTSVPLKESTSKPAVKSRDSSQLATSQMSLVELQFMAKSRGIPFGGLTRTTLAKKINSFY